MLKAIFGKHVFGDIAPAQPASESCTKAANETALPLIDIKRAIDNHVHWRQRLEEAILGRSTTMYDPEEVGAPDRCELGKWLHGEGMQRFGHLPLFTDLEAVHAQLHQRSGVILAKAQTGQRDLALSELQGVEFSRIVARLKNLLAKLYVEVLAAGQTVAA